MDNLLKLAGTAAPAIILTTGLAGGIETAAVCSAVERRRGRRRFEDGPETPSSRFAVGSGALGSSN